MQRKEQTFPFFFFATESHDVISVIENNLLRLLFNRVYTLLFQISCSLPLHFRVNAAVCTALANKKIKCNSLLVGTTCCHCNYPGRQVVPLGVGSSLTSVCEECKALVTAMRAVSDILLISLTFPSPFIVLWLEIFS